MQRRGLLDLFCGVGLSVSLSYEIFTKLWTEKKKPVRNPLAQSVQVMATPRGNRQKDVYGGLPFASQSQGQPLPEINEIPPSSALRAISSTPRNRVQKSRPTATIEQTPSRAGSKLARSSRLDMSSSNVENQIEQPGLTPMMSLQKPKYALNSPYTIMKSSNFPILETPSKPSQVIIHTIADLGEEIKSTPIKRLHNNTPLSPIQNPECSRSATKDEICIYKTLGWDDDIDDLL